MTVVRDQAWQPSTAQRRQLTQKLQRHLCVIADLRAESCVPTGSAHWLEVPQKQTTKQTKTTKNVVVGLRLAVLRNPDTQRLLCLLCACVSSFVLDMDASDT